MKSQPPSKGFTIVELLIVIVVIAILAAITIVAYNGIQARARDAQRQQDVQTITKALELYYTDNGQYPTSACASSCPTPKKINSAWSTTSDGTWSILEAQLVPKYLSSLPKDPLASTTTSPAINLGYNYDYVTNTGWCAAGSKQDYLLEYSLETSSQARTISGDCSTGTTPSNYSGSEYYVKK